jgi:hypothetical protein
MDSEADYVNHYCQQWQGQIEYRLSDRTRVDCLTETQAIEFDWCKKWAEGIGQALYYSKMTGKAPTVALICKKSEERFIDRLSKAAPHIELIVILNDKE